MRTEKEKMLSGELYNAFDAELAAESSRAKALLSQINQLSWQEQEERKRLIKELIPACSDDVILISPFYCDYGLQITIGTNVFINAGCTMLDCGKITIGNHVLIAPHVQIYAATHPLDYLTRRTVEYTQPVTIEDDCWIGGGAIICPGVTIGARSVVAAGAVVIRSVPPDSLVAGNPAVIKRDLSSVK